MLASLNLKQSDIHVPPRGAHRILPALEDITERTDVRPHARQRLEEGV